MAHDAGDSFVGPLQMEVGVALVVEANPGPAGRLMAAIALCGAGDAPELSSVDVFVTALTDQGSGVEPGSRSGGPGVLVTARARRHAMRAQKWKPCRRVVETGEHVPGSGRVTRLAVRGRFRQRARAPSRLMGIFVAAGAGAVLHPELQRRVRLPREGLMTPEADDGPVGAGQRESARVVIGEREGRGTEAVDGVAGLAGAVGQVFELTVVGVGMTIQAGVGSRMVVRVGSAFVTGRVAAVALNRLMHADQGIGRLRVVLGGERGGPEAFHVVTARAVSAVRTAQELAGMLIFVAVQAPVVRNRLGETRTVVAGGAGLIGMGPFKREGRLAVIEGQGGPDVLPTGSVVAAATLSGSESGAVRVGMAVLASLESETPELRRVALVMTTVASDAGVKAGEREPRFLMPKSGGRTPPLERVATGAVLTQPVSMDVFMTRRAGLREAEHRSVQVHEDSGLLFGRNMGGFMAVIAAQLRVAALEPIPGLVVVESVPSGRPLQDLEIPPEVLGVTVHARFVPGLRRRDPGVVSGPRLNPVGDLGVTARAPELRPADAEGMAARALEQAVQVAVGFRQRAGRQLRMRGSRQRAENHQPSQNGKSRPGRQLDAGTPHGFIIRW